MIKTKSFWIGLALGTLLTWLLGRLIQQKKQHNIK